MTEPLVFISYSRRDEDRARALKSYLEDKGLNIFIDTSGLRSGDEWRARLAGALDAAFALVVVCTRASAASAEVSFEWAYAMGRGIPVVPLLYEPDCPLPEPLQPLQRLDFTDPATRQWGKLFEDLGAARREYRPVGPMLRKSGLSRITFSRDEMGAEFTIPSILRRVRDGSEVLVVARSCEAWVREFDALSEALNRKSVAVILAAVSPRLPKERWFIKSDYAQTDIRQVLEKLRRIRLDPGSSGTLRFYHLPNAPLLSFVRFVEEGGHEVGLVEAGASLPLSERTTLILRAGGHHEGLMLKRLYTIYSRTLEGREPVFSLPEAVP